MATASTIVLTPNDRGSFAVPNVSIESSEIASKLLQTNHVEHDIIFTDMGLHNHISHHILTAFALGASSETLEKRYARNAAYQRPTPPLDSQIAHDLQEPTFFLKNLSRIKYYPHYLLFFQREIEAKGYEKVLDEYVFKGDERANIMFARLYAGTLHPLIHLGFGVEFKQPAIVAEALGQTAIHPPWLDTFFFDAEKMAAQSQEPSKPLVAILDEIRNDKKLSTAAHWDDQNQIRDGVLVRARAEIVKYASNWRVDPKDLEEARAEMVNAAVYFTALSQHPPKIPKFDFYFMHSVTASIFFSPLLSLSVPATTKAKMLENKARMDLLQYASRGAPKLLLEEVTHYVPKKKDASDWASIFERANNVDDDGHGVKLVRALAHGEKLCKPWEEKEWCKIRGGMWLQIGNMAIDSIEGIGEGDRWVRGAGFDEAWENYPDRS